MLKIAQKDSETSKFRHFEVSQNVGYTPATPGLENCSIRHGSVCRKAHVCLKKPKTPAICCFYVFFVLSAGRPRIQQEIAPGIAIAGTCCLNTAFHSNYRSYRPFGYSFSILQNFRPNLKTGDSGLSLKSPFGNILHNPSAFKFVLQMVIRATSRIRARAGIKIDTRIAIIAITTNNSTNVNPLSFCTHFLTAFSPAFGMPILILYFGLSKVLARPGQTKRKTGRARR